MKLFLKKVFLCLLLLAGAIESLYSQGDYDQYYKQLKEQYKKESLGYKISNGFELNPGFSKYAIGVSKFVPLNNGSSIKQNIGLHYRNSHLEASFYNYNQDQEENLIRWRAGYFRPYGKFKIGKRVADVKGLLLQPVYGLGALRNDGNWGAYVSPGIHLQLPFSVLSARLNIDYDFKQGVSILPELSLQLDALRTLLSPSLIKTGEGTSTSTSSTPLGGGWYLTKTTSEAYDVYIKDIGPFWSITPRYGFMPASLGVSNYEGNLESFGLGASFRVNFLGADIKFAKGATTFKDMNLKDAPKEMKNFDYNRVCGFVNTNELSFEGNVNIVGLVMGLISSHYSSMPMTTTPLNRFNFHLGLSYLTAKSSNFKNVTDARHYTDSFFAINTNVERNTETDPFQTSNEWAVSYGVSYEMGAVGFGVFNKLSKTMGRSTMMEVYYMIPVSKVIKAYK